MYKCYTKYNSNRIIQFKETIFVAMGIELEGTKKSKTLEILNLIWNNSMEYRYFY